MARFLNNKPISHSEAEEMTKFSSQSKQDRATNSRNTKTTIGLDWSSTHLVPKAQAVVGNGFDYGKEDTIDRAHVGPI